MVLYWLIDLVTVCTFYQELSLLHLWFLYKLVRLQVCGLNKLSLQTLSKSSASIQLFGVRSAGEPSCSISTQ